MLKKIGGKVVSVALASGMAVGQAYAALPAEVTAATTDMKADAVALAGIFLVAGIAVTAFLFLKKGAKA